MTKEQEKMLQETHDEVLLIKPILNRLQKVIDGNGKRGIDTRLTTIETQREDCPARKAYLHGHRQTSKILWVAVASVVINGISVAAAVAFHAMKAGAQ